MALGLAEVVLFFGCIALVQISLAMEIQQLYEKQTERFMHTEILV